MLAVSAVVLAPMAGITNPPYRGLCRSFGAGLYVSEMITARALLERNARTLRLAGFDPEETPRSLQLYAVDPAVLAEVVAGRNRAALATVRANAEVTRNRMVKSPVLS